MASLYASLGFPTDDPVISGLVKPLNPDVQTQLDMVPSLLKPWQIQDMANNDAHGFYYNPASVGISTALEASHNHTDIELAEYITSPNAEISGIISSIRTMSISLQSTVADQFQYHTDRMSNVTEIGHDITNPHHDTALIQGKVLMFILSKTDNVQNTAPVIGSFSSILASNAINSNANTWLTLSKVYDNSITYTTGGGGEGIYVSGESNISLSTARTLYEAANNTYSMMVKYRQQDINFYTNSKSVIDSFNKVTRYSNMGQSETDLVMNYIGTDKIKSRLSS